MADLSAVLVAARDEEASIARTVEALCATFPGVEVIVADDGSRDGTVAAAERAGARVLSFPARGKGQALTLAEREAPPGRILLADADLDGDLARLAAADGDVAIAVFAERQGGGFGIAKRAARTLVRALSGFTPGEPLSGQRALSEAARGACFPLAAGFGCEVRMTIDAVRAGLRVSEVELSLRHRPTGRDAAGFAHRGRQLLDAVLACGPSDLNYRGLRLPLVGGVVGLRRDPAVAAVAALGLADDLWSGAERGFRAHLGRGRTTGVLKLLGIPLIGLLATRRLSGALLVGLAANFLNQLDTRPGRALKAYLLAAPFAGAPVGVAVMLAPYDLREMTMLGDAGANALGAMLGLNSVSKLTDRGRWCAIGVLAGLTLLGETRSLGELIERTPFLRELDALGRQP
ncbi:MAG TPA: glycosyltransferase [Gaiellaceae bacterium]|nr:glycosyltransferase [Gaiellaceae bacterium]